MTKATAAQNKCIAGLRKQGWKLSTVHTRARIFMFKGKETLTITKTGRACVRLPRVVV